MTDPVNEPRRRLRQLELVHAVVAVLACGVAAWIGSAEVVRGIAFGAVLGGLNARALAALVGRVTDAASPPAGPMALIFLKMLILLAAVGAVLLWANVDAAAFVAGISAAPLLWLLGSLVAASQPRQQREVSR